MQPPPDFPNKFATKGQTRDHLTVHGTLNIQKKSMKSGWSIRKPECKVPADIFELIIISMI